MKHLHELWLSRAVERSDAIAVKDATGAHRYRALAERSHDWAASLRHQGLRAGDRVVIVADASFASICLLTGCSIAGVVFTVIAPDVPEARRQAIIDELSPALVAVDTRAFEQPASGLVDPVFQRFSLTRLAQPPRSHDEPRALDTDPAYIVFTSGSTGKPKGIVMSHAAVVSFWDGLIEQFALAPSRRYASLSPLQFDFSLLDIGLCLGSGATLLLPQRALLRKPAQLVDVLVDWRATQVSAVPTVWKLILQLAKGSITRMTELERIVFAGEHFPVEHMRSIHALLPRLDFFNIYGQSESIACTFHAIGADDIHSGKPHLPVGRGHRDMEMMLFADDGTRVARAGVAGELYLRGRPLFSGYWNAPAETAARLVQNPMHSAYPDLVFRTGDTCYFDEDGLYYFIGRRDNQIKINGNRVELEEIEKRLNAFPGVTNSCVMPVRENDSLALHAAVVAPPAGSGSVPEEIVLREFLSASLPAYMLPKRYHFCDSIPISENGKNDRRRLTALLNLETR